LQERILARASAGVPDDVGALDAASADIHSLFEQGSMPRDVADDISAAYRQLGSNFPPVAGRSSATAEDLPGLSFAGQQKTYLNLVGAEAVLEAVKRCWARLWTARAIGNRARNGIPPGSVALAVVVRRMVQS
jgi:pyruvate,water dikinase